MRKLRTKSEGQPWLLFCLSWPTDSHSSVWLVLIFYLYSYFTKSLYKSLPWFAPSRGMGLLGQRLEHVGKRRAQPKRNTKQTYLQVRKWLTGPGRKRDEAETATVKTPLRKTGLGTMWEEREKQIKIKCYPRPPSMWAEKKKKWKRGKCALKSIG